MVVGFEAILLCKLVATIQSSDPLPPRAHTHLQRGEGERMAIALVSVPTPRQTICTRRSYTYSNSWFHSSATTLIKYQSKPVIIPPCSSSTSSTSVVEDGPPPPPPSDALPTTEDDNLPLRYFPYLLFFAVALYMDALAMHFHLFGCQEF